MLLEKMYKHVLLFFLLPPGFVALKTCFQEKTFIRYHKVRTCYRSTMPPTSWKTLNSPEECMNYTRQKNGLAFNFGPLDLKNMTQNRRYKNCQVLGCPETYNTSTLVFDPFFDYYSAFGDFNATKNSTCIKSVGLYALIHEKRNYTEAVNFCQSLDSDLADVLSESRTNTLAALLKSLSGWYKAAYVGLEDTEVEGKFETPMGNFLDCTKFRAWGVGHPRPGRKREDCVILDAERVWRAINCKIKLPFICEFYPSAPDDPIIDFGYKNCSKIKNVDKKQQCLANQELLELYNNSSRIDQCALTNDFE